MAALTAACIVAPISGVGVGTEVHVGAGVHVGTGVQVWGGLGVHATPSQATANVPKRKLTPIFTHTGMRLIRGAPPLSLHNSTTALHK